MENGDRLVNWLAARNWEELFIGVVVFFVAFILEDWVLKPDPYKYKRKFGRTDFMVVVAFISLLYWMLKE